MNNSRHVDRKIIERALDVLRRARSYATASITHSSTFKEALAGLRGVDREIAKADEALAAFSRLLEGPEEPAPLVDDTGEEIDMDYTREDAILEAEENESTSTGYQGNFLMPYPTYKEECARTCQWCAKGISFRDDGWHVSGEHCGFSAGPMCSALTPADYEAGWRAALESSEENVAHLEDKMERAVVAVVHFTHRYNEDLETIKALRAALANAEEDSALLSRIEQLRGVTEFWRNAVPDFSVVLDPDEDNAAERLCSGKSLREALGAALRAARDAGEQEKHDGN